MANTIIAPTLFAKEVIRNRDIKNVFFRHTNSDYTGELRKEWDTVTVQTLPTLSFATGTAGDPIAATDFTITSENLVIDTTKQLRVTLKDIEITQSNLTLEEKVAERFAEAEARLFDETVRDQILVTQVADIPAANKLDSGAPIAVDKTNAYTVVEKLKVALAKQNVSENLVCFVSPSFAAAVRLSGLLDNTDMGLKARFKGFVGMVSGVMMIETNALTASEEVIMMESGAVNMVVQLNQYDVRQADDGFYENLIAEVIYGLKIFGENAKAIAIQYISGVTVG